MRDIISEVLSTLRQNKMRTALTGFAVSWGIFIIIVLIGAGNGLLNAFAENSEGEIKKTIIVYPGATSIPYKGKQMGEQTRLSDRDFALAESFPDIIDDVKGSLSFSGTIQLGKESLSSEFLGTDEDFAKTEHLNIVAGRYINKKDQQDLRKVLVLDTDAASQVLGDNQDFKRIIGKNVAVGDILFRVIGVYKNDGATMWGHQSYVPYNTVKKMRTDSKWLTYYEMEFHGLETPEENKAFEQRYTEKFNESHEFAPEDKSTIYLFNRYMSNKEMVKGMKIMRTALWILGLLTLLSGIVGVSNIMLITVKERIHEFGIRKALGAKPSSILNLIVVESIAITAFFGYIGMSIGMLANHYLDATLGSSPLDLGFTQIYMFKNVGVGLDVAIKATVLLIVAGTIAGIIPAWKGARVRPIEALRAEK